MSAVTRRRAITALAAVAGIPLALLGRGDRAAPPLARWRGVALGARAEITLCHPDRTKARAALEACVDEIDRLDRVFSLYRAEGALVAFNRAGRLSKPPHDLIRLMAQARRFHGLGDGAFDVTVQPLWRLYADHFARPGADPRGPGARAIAMARARVDGGAIEISPRLLRFARPGMAVTLNGIAQGAITDAIADLLRDAGFDQALVGIGELRALGDRGEGPWRIGIDDPRHPGTTPTTLALVDAALATSGGYGTRFDARGRFHHLFDPASGVSPGTVLSASVVAPRATAADALATTLAVSDPARAAMLVDRFGASHAELKLADGRVVIVDAG